MRTDILLPRDNEEQLLEQAEKIGFKQVILLYTHAQKPRIPEKTSITVQTACYVEGISSINKYKKGFDRIIGPVQRNFFENSQTNYLLNQVDDSKRESMHQRRSDLDYVMCRLAKEKGKTIIFPVNKLDAKSLGRIMQDARLCRKHRVKTITASLASHPLEMRAPKDLDGYARMIKLL